MTNIEKTKQVLINNKISNNRIIIAGDNDITKERNIGKEKAEETAREFNLPLVLPIFKDTASNPSDFDDLRQLEGTETVREILIKYWSY